MSLTDGIKGLDGLDVRGKRVFVRLDLNTPLDDAGGVSDDTRIRQALPTLRVLAERGARIICASHLGRPKGKVVAGLSLEPVAARLAELWSKEVVLVDEVVGDGARNRVAALREGDLMLLENLRFHPGETANDPALAKELAALCDVYVNDAFGTAHRAHASTEGLARLVPERGAGLLMLRELEMFDRILSAPHAPFVALIGGAKVASKIGVLRSLLDKVEVLLIGGAMANTFLLAHGAELGASSVEPDKLGLARDLLGGAKARGVRVLLPSDLVVAPAMDAPAGEVVDSASVPAPMAAYDIGPETRARFAEAIAAAKLVFWNGPVGVFEKEPFAAGTLAMARAVADTEAITVVGGGDSVAALVRAGVVDAVTHVSTGGGASLELVEGRTLPGVAALRTS